MKKNLTKLIAALLAALILAAPVLALAEETAPESAPVVKEEVKTEAPKTEAPKTEAPKAEEPKAEEPKAEEPKAEEPKAEEPKAEEPKAEEPKAEEPAVEEPAAEEPAVEQPVEEPAEQQPEKFTGVVEVKRIGSGTLYYGDKIKLRAVVTGANVEYSVRWEAKIKGEWKKQHSGPEYEFKIEKDNAELPYRAVVVAANKANEKASDIYKLPEVTEKPVVEQPAEEEPAEEEPAEEEPAEEEPAEEEPVEEEPAEEEPAEEEPAEEEPAEEEPVEEEPVEEEPAEEEPAEEEPVEITSDEEAEELEDMPVVLDAEIDAEPIRTVAAADVRVDADGLSEIFATVDAGTELNVLGVEGDWVLVEIEVDGEMMQGYIFVGDVEGLPEEDEAEAAEAKTEKKVTIFSSRRTVMAEGETVYLTSLLEGFEDARNIRYIWKVNKGDGFEEIPGANGDTYSFIATEESLGWDWHLTVQYI